SPDPSVETSNDQNQISQTQVHGTRGRRRRWHDKFRWRFRLVSPVPADSDGKSGAPIQRCSINCWVRSGQAVGLRKHVLGVRFQIALDAVVPAQGAGDEIDGLVDSLVGLGAT